MFDRFFKPTIRDRKDLWRYVFTVIGACVGITLSLDVANQLLFFADWSTALRSWILTTLEAGGLSLPISLGIGETNLELYEAKRIAERASRVDHLTGLLNRRALMETVASYKAVTLALVIADIDLFKRVNDTHGHLVGDIVIAEVARVLEQELGGIGALARVGGEEFALLVADASLETIEAKLEAARRRISQMPVMADDRPVPVTISMGLATGFPGENFQQLYGKADRALYLAKTAGRNRVLRYDRIEQMKSRATGDDPREIRREARSA
jgi:diguanylate cyclase (GGDEF)-like protein